MDKKTENHKRPAAAGSTKVNVVGLYLSYWFWEWLYMRCLAIHVGINPVPEKCHIRVDAGYSRVLIASFIYRNEMKHNT
jgi:hypothetical protein